MVLLINAGKACFTHFSNSNVFSSISIFKAKKCFAALSSSPYIMHYRLSDAVSFATAGNSLEILKYLPFQGNLGPSSVID